MRKEIKMNRQAGSAMIISLIVLSAITILGMATFKTTNTQQVVLRNTQLISMAVNTATSEINAQISAINSNDGSDDDPIILRVLDAGGADYDIVANANPANGIQLFSPQTRFTQDVNMRLMSEEAVNVPSGNTENIGKAGIKSLSIEIQSTATLGTTSASSTQIQGYSYITPSGV